MGFPSVSYDYALLVNEEAALVSGRADYSQKGKTNKYIYIERE